MNYLIIGGCHIEGYPIGFQDSFVHNLALSPSDQIAIESNFPLSHMNSITQLIEKYKPAVVLLQLGNYEFDASIKKTIQLWKKKYQPAAAVNGAPEAPRHGDDPKAFMNYKATTLLQWLLIPFIARIRLALATKYLLALKTIINQHKTIKFILLTPLPLAKATDNWVRKRAALYFTRVFRPLDNVVLVDTHGTLKTPSIFADPSHLNKTGHTLLQHALEREISKL